MLAVTVGLDPDPTIEETESRESSSRISLVGEPGDGELVGRLVNGDQWAQDALYRKYVQSVWRLALRLLGNRSDAEDVVQDAFTEAFRDCGKLREASAVRPWLMRITVHQVHRRFRKRKLLRALGLDRGEDDVSLDALAGPGASAETMAELRILDQVLRRIPTAARIAWMLRHVEGCTLEEVAERCSCSLATAKRRIAAARHEVDRHVEVLDA